jgi:hypothetical protein
MRLARGGFVALSVPPSPYLKGQRQVPTRLTVTSPSLI